MTETPTLGGTRVGERGSAWFPLRTVSAPKTATVSRGLSVSATAPISGTQTTPDVTRLGEGTVVRAEVVSPPARTTTDARSDAGLYFLRAEGEVLGDAVAVDLLAKLCEQGELGPEVAREMLTPLVKLAAAGLLFSADNRLFATVSGIQMYESLRAAYPLAR